MTGMELSSIARHGLRPIVMVLNNGGYGTERPMQEGPFNDILNWRYSRVPEVLGKGLGFHVETEEELEFALVGAAKNEKSFSIIEVRLDPLDRSPALHRLAARLAKRV